MASEIAAFSSFLKAYYNTHKVEELLGAEAPFFAQVRARNVAAYRSYSGESAAPAITMAGVAALTTIAGLEWLRHRKNEIAAAEKTGDYSSLIDEFFEWMRAMLRMWREALSAKEAA